jgi:molybdate transport system substrate-binding protein
MRRSYNLWMKILSLLILFSAQPLFAKDLTIFAASSLSDSLTAIAKKYERTHKTKIILAFDASSRLAKQIEQGAPADLYFSADKLWNRYLEDKKIISKENSQDLLSNKLVLISPKNRIFELNEMKNLPLLKFKNLAVAQETVPAGRYAYEVLKNLGITEPIKSRLVTGDTVRNVLSWVAKDETDFGIVFATDAKVEPKVKVLLNIDPKLHSEIIYPLSIIKNSDAAKDFYDYCQSEEAKAVFIAAGFDWLGKK